MTVRTEYIRARVRSTGASVATRASSAIRYSAFARERDIDAAVLDVNLHGLRSYPAADALGARGIPFVFVTGYGDRDLRELYPGCPVIPKPYKDIDLIAALAALISAVSSVRQHLS